MSTKMLALKDIRWSLQILFLVIMVSLFSKVKSNHCSSHQFHCGNGKCVPIIWHCDEDNDCGDNSDESNCETRTCSETEFKCANSKCIPSRWLCDNEDDCGDISDESPSVCQNKTCSPDQFSCASSSGMCIPVTWRCDGQEDCPDGSDEKVDCQQITCTEEEFTCQNNKCITKTWVCDQDDDCGDGSDEKNCPNVTCSTSEFMCANGKCIPQRWFCDGDVDCFDNSDELSCPDMTSPCSLKEFMCASRDCIHSSWVCDGDPDCPDKSDEVNCTSSCRPDEFQCENNACILKKLQCNGISECGDNSDENQCSKPTCNSETEFDCGENKCISINKVCDGKNDCGNWKDEPHGLCFINECAVNNGGCSQKCIDTSVGFHCGCLKGYALVDNQTCEDVNECEIPGSCSQLCDNTKGSFKCSCFKGYSIEPSNHHRCKAQEGHAALLFANRHDIRRINLETMEYTSVVGELRSTVALDYDYASQTVFWSDVSDETINSAPIANGSPVTHVIQDKVMTPDGIAVDWIYRNIYWTDTGRNTIEVSDMSGKYRTVLISQGLDEPRAIVVNPLEGWMFWTDWGEPAKIERAGMDGSRRSTIVSTNIRWPNGLAIDFVSKKIFWADAKLHCFCNADYDGKNQRVILISSAIVKHPFSIDVFEDWLYWSDWESESIHRVNKFTGQDLKNVGVSIYSPMNVRVFHSYKQPKGQNYCSFSSGRCSHLCLPTPRLNEYSAKYLCACPTGMRISPNMKNCIDIETATTSPTDSTVLSGSPKANQAAPPSTPLSSIVFYSTSTPQTAPTSEKFLNSSQSYSETSISPLDNSSQGSQTPISNSIDIAPEKGTNETLMGVRSDYEELDDDTGRLAGIVIGSLGGLVCVLSVFGFCIYNHYLRRNVTSMNFDNPVYRKTTEDQFSLEKNQYQPARSYPPSLEPLTSPGTNEFV